MASIVVAGDTSGTVTLTAPLVAGTTTLTLPTANGTLITTGSTTGIDASAISSGTLPAARLPAGSILQVVQTYSSTQISFTNTASWASSGITATITPASSSNRILIMTSFGNGQSANGFNNIFSFSRNGTVIGGNTGQNNAWIGEDVYMSANLTTSAAMYIDSPATTSALTYALLVRCDGNTGYLNRSGSGGDATVGFTTGSTQIILMEIAG